ncbi:hypothetical protein DIPPA_11606 [Diplonema papillatum]|nr:hypothetical protein DIPPA_11606 [Diplonema papillatum]
MTYTAGTRLLSRELPRRLRVVYVKNDRTAAGLLRLGHRMGVFEADEKEARTALIQQGYDRLYAAGYAVGPETEAAVVELLARSGDLAAAFALAEQCKGEVHLPAIFPGLLLDRLRQGETCVTGIVADAKLVFHHARRRLDEGKQPAFGYLTLRSILRSLTAFKVMLGGVAGRRKHPMLLWVAFARAASTDRFAPAACVACVSAHLLAFSTLKTAEAFADRVARYQIRLPEGVQPARPFSEQKTERYFLNLMKVARDSGNVEGFKRVLTESRAHGFQCKTVVWRTMLLAAWGNLGNWPKTAKLFTSLGVPTPAACISVLRLCGRNAGRVGDVWEVRAEKTFDLALRHGLEDHLGLWRKLMYVYSRTYNADKARKLLTQHIAGGNELFDQEVIVAYSVATKTPVAVCLEKLFPLRHQAAYFYLFSDDSLMADGIQPEPVTSFLHTDDDDSEKDGAEEEEEL